MRNAGKLQALHWIRKEDKMPEIILGSIIGIAWTAVQALGVLAGLAVVLFIIIIILNGGF
jgi:hypothetical protein